MDTPGAEPTVNLSKEAVLDFTAWSADRGPLHVDPVQARHSSHLERQVGVLSVLEALRVVGPKGTRPICSLDIECGAVLIGETYSLRAFDVGSDLMLGLHAGDRLVLNLRAGFVADSRPDALDLSWVTAAASSVRETPAARGLEELQGGVLVTGCYPASPAGFRTPSCSGPTILSPTGARVLALCSYVTGMEVPGPKSLFTRITLAFHGDAPEGADLCYRARTTRFDQKLRLLDTELVVATAEGELVATGLLRSYVPFSPVRTDLSLLSDRLVDATRALRGKVALVTGGSRGLGADIASTLALAGSHVYVTARHDDDERRAHHDALRGRDAQVDFVQGDAGDPDWCDSMLETIRARHGRLDVLVLNACESPTPMRWDPLESTCRHASLSIL